MKASSGGRAVAFSGGVPLGRSLVRESMKWRRCAARPSRYRTALISPTQMMGDAPTGGDGTERKLRVLSGVQPTGALHLGNYLGAIRQWTLNQDKYESFFSVVDLHAITLPHDPKQLAETSYAATAMYLACGIDPAKSKIFIQSHVSAHAEMTWLLNCITPMNWLEKMIQYKEKSRKMAADADDEGSLVSVKDNASGPGIGLFSYPVLMAADILLYGADLVPVGEDQTQHLELARDIARRYNDLFGKRRKKAKLPPVFKEPKALILKGNGRVMALDDGTNKMSKSAENDGSRINMTDSADVIKRKIKRCKTDSVTGMKMDDPDRPECRNLLGIYQAVTDKTTDEINAEVADMNWGGFKPILTDAVIAHLDPIQSRYKEIMEDRDYLKSVLREGRAEAQVVAGTTLQNAQEYMGFALARDLDQ